LDLLKSSFLPSQIGQKEETVKKKIFVTGAALLATAFIGQTVSAKTLEDILKEKGVITEAEYKEATKVKPISYKIGKGFTLMSPDQKFSLTIGGYLQPRYSFADKDSDWVSTSAANTKNQRQDVSEFRMRRAKFVLSGNAFTKDLTYKLQIEFTQAGNARLLEDAWMNYKILDEAQIRGGQDKVPFSRQWLNSAWALEFIDRSNASDTFYAGRDLGVMLHGKIPVSCNGNFTYIVGGYGGAGQSILSTNNDNALAARVVFNPLGEVPYVEGDIDVSEKPLVAVGADYYRNTFQRGTNTNGFTTNNVQFISGNLPFTNPSVPQGWLGNGSTTFNSTEKVTVNTFSADVAFKWLGLYVQGEYYYGQGEGETSDKFLRAMGGYGQIGYMILPKHLEAAYRFSIVDPNTRVSNDMRIENQGAISYYFNNHYLKLQADITNRHIQQLSNPTTNDMIYKLQAQVMF
jgi:phosphate-selective porin OprO/OprP